MKPLTLDDIPSLDAFAAIRPQLREAVLAHKASRRVAVGDRVTLLFEDRETVRWQVLEMCRVEGTHEPSAVAQEVAVYNELVPGEHELSATLFIEITELAEIRPELDRMVGIDEHVALLVGGERVAARFDEAQMEEDRISAVHYVRFPFTAAQAQRFLDPSVPVEVAIDHPAYDVRIALPDAARTSLCIDLSGEPEPLVDLAALPRPAAAAEQLIAEREGFRIVRPARPGAAHHLQIVANEGPGFCEVEPEQLRSALALAQELAQELRDEHGACRVSIDPDATPLRIDVFTPRT